MDSFRTALDANLAEFRKNVLLEVAKLGERLARDSTQSLQAPQQSPSAMILSSRSNTTTTIEKSEKDDKGLNKQGKKKFKSAKKNSDPKNSAGLTAAGIGALTDEADRLLEFADVSPSGILKTNTNATLAGKTATVKTVAASSADPIVVASCPESFHDEVVDICLQKDFAKAFGQKGDMVDMLSGEDWVGKWEAKVVISAVTQARAMKQNTVKIICIQGGKHCDKEVAAQPRLKKAIVQEFGENLRVGMEWLEMDEFRERYVPKDAGDGSMKIFFCHKHTNSVDAVMNLKLQLEQRLPKGKSTFYNLGFETEASLEKADVEIKSCSHFVIFLTKGALSKQHVVSQIRSAIENNKSCLLVMETDKAYGGVNLSDEIEKLEDELVVEAFKTNMMIPWSREDSVQEVSLDRIVASLTERIEDKRLLRMRTELALQKESIVFHPWFQIFCNCAGVALPGAWRITYIVSYVAVALAGLSFVSAVALMFFPMTSDFRDRRDLVANPATLANVAISSLVMRRAWESPEVQALIALHKNDVHLSRRIHTMSKQLTIFGVAIFIPIAAFVVVQFLYFFLKWDADSVSPSHQALRISMGVTLFLAAIPCLMQGCCLIGLTHCCFYLIIMSFASAFNQLHPQIRDFGIHRSVEQGMIIHVSDSDFVRFQRSYTDVWKKVRVMLSWLSCALIVIQVTWTIHFFMHVISVFRLARNGRPDDAIEGLDKEGWHLTIRPALVFAADAVFLGPFLYMHLFRQSLSQWVARLIFTKSATRVAVGNFVNELLIDFPLLPVTDRFRLDAAMTPYVVFVVVVRWFLACFELYIVDYDY